MTGAQKEKAASPARGEAAYKQHYDAKTRRPAAVCKGRIQ